MGIWLKKIYKASNIGMMKMGIKLWLKMVKKYFMMNMDTGYKEISMVILLYMIRMEILLLSINRLESLENLILKVYK